MNTELTDFEAIASDGLERLHVWRPKALSVLGPGWRDLVRTESVNQRLLLEALVNSATEVSTGSQVHVEGMSPITEPLCRRLRSIFARVTLSLRGYPTDAKELFGCPVMRDELGSTDRELTLGAHFGLQEPSPARSSHERLDLNHRLVQAHYAEQLPAHRTELAARLEPFTKRGGEAVIFVSRKAYYNQLRMSRALQRRGVRTAAVLLDSRSYAHKQDYFDEVLSTDLCSLLFWLSGAEGACLHTQGWLFGYHLPCLIDAFVPSSCQHTVELMDIQSFFFPEADLERLLPHMRIAFGPDVRRRHARQLRCEQYLLEHADALILTGTESHSLNSCRERKRRSRCLCFLSYPLPDFFAAPARPAPRNGTPACDLRLVFAGGIPPFGPTAPAPIFGDAQLLIAARQLLEGGLSLDVYNNPLLATQDTFRSRYAPHLELERQFPRYRFLEGALPWDLSNLLCQYDYGLMLYDHAGMLVGEPHYQHMVPTKLMMYLEAGLPVLISERIADAAALVQRYRIGCVVPEGALTSLPELLSRLNHAQLRDNVLQAREELSMDRQIPRLVELYARAPRSAPS